LFLTKISFPTRSFARRSIRYAAGWSYASREPMY
jgi:hypothetical protein